MGDGAPDQVSEFEREGLLEGLADEEREARIDLLRQLVEVGVSMDDLKRAVAEDRLAMLPIEMVFTRECKYTLRDAMEASGLDDDFVRRDFLALGLPHPAEDEVLYTEEDVESFKAVKQVLDAGLPAERMLELARIVGRAAAQSSEESTRSSAASSACRCAWVTPCTASRWARASPGPRRRVRSRSQSAWGSRSSRCAPSTSCRGRSSAMARPCRGGSTWSPPPRSRCSP